MLFRRKKIETTTSYGCTIILELGEDGFAVAIFLLFHFLDVCKRCVFFFFHSSTNIRERVEGEDETAFVVALYFFKQKKRNQSWLSLTDDSSCSHVFYAE